MHYKKVVQYVVKKVMKEFSFNKILLVPFNFVFELKMQIAEV